MSLREERRLSPAALLHDGPSGSRPEEQTSRQTDEAAFAQQLAQALYGMKRTGASEALVLVADPQTVGQLRDAVHENVEAGLVLTLAKDLTNHPAGEIAQALT